MPDWNVGYHHWGLVALLFPLK